MTLSNVCTFALIALAVLPGCEKSNQQSVTDPTVKPVPKPTSPTLSMGGIRNWHRYFFNSMPYNTAGVTEHGPDTTFSISVIDSQTVEVATTRYSLVSKDTVRKMLHFGTASYFFSTYEQGRGVVYFYGNDSIAVVEGDNSHNGKYKLVYYTFE